MKNIFKKMYVYLILIFFYAPIAILIFYSFNASKSRAVWAGFTVKWYSELFQNTEIIHALFNTLIVAIAATVISMIIGTIGAIGLYNSKSRLKKVVMESNYLPMLNPDIVIAVSLVALYNFMKLEFGYLTLIMSHVAFTAPYVLFNVMPRLMTMDPNMYEAAIDLGANRWQAFRMVVLPEIKPGILSGALMAFTLSIDDFVVSFFTTGNGIQNISITVWSMARRGINPTINALSAIMFVVMISLTVFIYIRNQREVKKRYEKLQGI